MSALEIEDGKTHATDLSASFYSDFQAVKKDISTRLESFGALDAKLSSGEALNSLASDIVKLRKSLVDATSYLPAYDRRQYEQQLKALEESLSHHRTPKSKFSFKRRPRNPSPCPTTTRPVSTAPHQSSTPAPSATTLALSSRVSERLTLSSLSTTLDDVTRSTITRSSDITLTNLTNCIVDLFTSPAPLGIVKELTIRALHGRALDRTVLVIPPIEGSVLLHDIQNSVIVVGCHQFRMHSSRNTTVLLHALSTPIIEGCSGIKFGEYPAALRDARMSAQTFTHASQHMHVQDFDWIKPSASPNWSILDPSSTLREDVARLIGVNNGLGDCSDMTHILDQLLPT